MSLAGGLLALADLIPLMAAARANRSTSLFHAVVWAAAAAAGWAPAWNLSAPAWDYLALGLTGCAGVAVLGARRPGVAAWNFVVLGLLAVLLLPLAEGTVLDTPLQPGTVRTLFLAVLLGVTVVNYLPTRLGLGAVLLGVGCGGELWRIAGGGAGQPATVAGLTPTAWCVGLTPWAAWVGLWLRRSGGTPFDRLWRSFRDRYGLVWGQRLREQFNRAADNAGLGVELGWRGLRPAGDPRTDAAAYETLAALMKRFGLP